MSDALAPAAGRTTGRPFDGSWLATAGLLLGTLAIGGTLGGLSRPLFVVGCLAVAIQAWRVGPAAHLRTMLLLLAFAPFVRRWVDLAIGYDPSSLMLIGPLLAMLVPIGRVFDLIDGRPPLDDRIGPLLLVGIGVAYALILAMSGGSWTEAASGALKWGAPLVYAASLLAGTDRNAMLRAAVAAFTVILPLLGLYGIFQYVDPPDWDRYWMQYASITSAGQPVPYGIRVFGPLNGPASYATFIATGLLLVGFLQPSRLLLLATAPAVVGFLLSLYRTAWLSLAVAVAVCVVFAVTRARAVAILAGSVVAGTAAALIPPFSDVILDRLQTLSRGSQDGSLQERFDQYLTLWTLPDSALFGVGFTTTDAGRAGAMPVDGMIIACWLNMGIVVGLVCLTGFLWAAWRPIARARRSPDRESVVLAGFAASALFQLPLANLGSGELGFLFWTFATLALCAPSPDREPHP